MAERVEVVVVGAGIMGAATAHALARAGRDVLVLEQLRVGHTRGSSHGASRIFRLAYPDAAWVRLAQEARDGWRRLERETGETLLTLTGLADVVADVAPHAAALDACGVAWELLDAGAARARLGLAVPQTASVVLQPEAGIAHADRAWHAFVAAAGVVVREEAAVTALDVADGSVTVATGDGAVEAAAVVVTAGPWARPLLAAAGYELDVTPTRETVTYFRGGDTPPSVIDYTETVRGDAAYALAAPGVGLKAGLHRSGAPADPDAPGDPDEELVALAADWVARRFPDVDPTPVATETCMYTNAPDGETFTLERRGRLVVGSPCSGHGFKFAPAVGERLAALAAEVLD